MAACVLSGCARCTGDLTAPCVCARARRLCELNVLKQVQNVCLTPTVQGAWKRGQTLAVHGLIYNPADGSLKVWEALQSPLYVTLDPYAALLHCTHHLALPPGSTRTRRTP